MLFTIKEDLDLIRDLKISPKQLMFIKMLVPDRTLDLSTWRRKCYAMSLEFQQLSPLTARELDDLIDKGVIIDLNEPGKPIYYDSYELEPKYLKRFSLAVLGFAGELHETYPRSIERDGKTFFLKNAAPEELSEAYMKAIRKDETLHKQVIDDLNWAIKHDKINIGIKNFVHSKYWLEIRELRKTIQPLNVQDGRIG